MIRGSCYDHTQRECCNPGGDGVEFSFNGAEAKGSEDSRGEVRITICRSEETEVHETTRNITPGWFNIKMGVTDIFNEPSLDKSLLVIGQLLGFFGEVRNDGR